MVNIMFDILLRIINLMSKITFNILLDICADMMLKRPVNQSVGRLVGCSASRSASELAVWQSCPGGPSLLHFNL